jgi:hypothetical protein
MSRCSPLGEAAVTGAEVENVEEIIVSTELERASGENLAASDGEGCAASPNIEDDLNEGASDNAKLRTCYFGSSTITIGKIKEMEERGYFLEGEGRAPGAETVLKPNGDVAVVYEDFFIAGLPMPPHRALADVLLHFQAQLHQLMPNTIAQLSKKFWTVSIFGGVPSGNLFTKRYELHYQPKIASTLEGDQIVQYECLNFHAKRDGSPKLCLTIKNKWSSRWTKSWFYYRVPCRWCSGGGKSVYPLHSWMGELDYTVEPQVECPDNDPNDISFVQVTVTTECRDAIKEYTTSKIFPLTTSFGFESVPLKTTPTSKVETPLSLFAVGTIAMEHTDHFLAEVET